jgi:hypothetical protein
MPFFKCCRLQGLRFFSAVGYKPTTLKNLLRCRPQRLKSFNAVGYNAKKPDFLTKQKLILNRVKMKHSKNLLKGPKREIFGTGILLKSGHYGWVTLKNRPKNPKSL